MILRGSALRGNETRVIVGGVQLSGSDLNVSDEQIAFDLPAGLRAGILSAQVAHLLDIGTPPTLHRGVESNVAAFVLQPLITKTGANYNISIIPAGGVNPRRLRVMLDPEVAPAQRATILLNELSAPASRPAFSFTFEAEDHTATTAQLTFAIPGVPAGTYLVRVRIDGAESPLDYVDPTGYVTPAVILT